MKNEKYYYIKVKEYIKDDIHDGFYDIGYFDRLEAWVGDDAFDYVKYYISTVSIKEVAKRYKSRAWAERKINTTYDFTKELKYFFPYEDNIYRYKFEIVEE